MQELDFFRSLPAKNQAWKLVRQIDEFLESLPADKRPDWGQMRHSIAVKLNLLCEKLEGDAEAPLTDLRIFAHKLLQDPAADWPEDFYHLYHVLLVVCQRGGRSDSLDIFRHLLRLGQPGTTPANSIQALPLTLLLYNIRSAYNCGNMLRSLACFGAKKAVLAGYTPDADHPGVIKAAMQSQNMIEIERCQDVLSYVENFDGAVICLENQNNATALSQWHWEKRDGHTRPILLIVGNEETGIADPLLAACDATVQIPLPGPKQSLNVANALAIFLHHASATYPRE